MSNAVAEPKSGPSPAVMGTYGRINVVFDRGEGSWLVATNGDRYLDFGSGIAVNTLGHAHPRLVNALSQQAGKVWHTSNLYRIDGQEKLAENLVANTFADAVFFLQFRRRGLRRRYQDRAALSFRQRKSRAKSGYYV